METGAETRLDRLWQGVRAAPGDDAAWVAFYEGLATARLYLPLAEDAGETARPRILETEGGPVALAFDTEERLAAAVSKATDYAAMPGAELCARLAGLSVGLVLNPGLPSETMLEPAALGWVGQHMGAKVSTGEGAGRVVAPPPEAALLDALGRRVADFGAHLAEAWLVGLAATGGGIAELALVIRPEGAGRAMADEIAAALTRVGQLATEQAFAVAPAEEGERLLTAARAAGIRIGA